MANNPTKPENNPSESEMTEAFAQRLGGSLIKECYIPGRRPQFEQRAIDGMVLLDRIWSSERGRRASETMLAGANVVVVQTKTGELEMPLLGQALFSRELIPQYRPQLPIRTVALCGRDHPILRRLAENQEIEVEVMEDPDTPYKPSTPSDPGIGALVVHYWKQQGGTLLTRAVIEEDSPRASRIRADGVLLASDTPQKRSMGRNPTAPDLAGEEIVLIHAGRTKRSDGTCSYGMYALGQAFFAAKILEARFPQKRIRTRIVCTRDDELLSPLAKKYGIEIEVLENCSDLATCSEEN